MLGHKQFREVATQISIADDTYYLSMLKYREVPDVAAMHQITGIT